MSASVLDAHVDLRLAAFERHDSFVPSPVARKALRKYLGDLHERGTVRVLEHGGLVRAVLAWRAEPDGWFGEPVTTVALDHSLREADSEVVAKWLDDVLPTELANMESDLNLSLDRVYGTAYRALLEHGLGIDSVVLLGRPEVALERLRARERPALPEDVTWVPMLPSQIDEVLELQRRFFLAEPQFCFFGANEAYLHAKREQLLEELATDAAHVQRVLLRAGEVVAHIAATVDHDNSFWGPCAGMSLLLDDSLRGRGLLSAVYERLLEAMIERGAKTFKGGTNQPPVLRLGRVMRRPLHTVLMRRRRFFDEAHFGSYVPG